MGETDDEAACLVEFGWRGFVLELLSRISFFSLTCTTVTPGLEFHIHTVQRQI